MNFYAVQPVKACKIDCAMMALHLHHKDEFSPIVLTVESCCISFGDTAGCSALQPHSEISIKCHTIWELIATIILYGMDTNGSIYMNRVTEYS